MIDMLLDAVLGSFPPMSQTTHEGRDDVMTVDRGNLAVIRGCHHVPYSRPPAEIRYLHNGSRLVTSRQFTYLLVMGELANQFLSVSFIESSIGKGRTELLQKTIREKNTINTMKQQL